MLKKITSFILIIVLLFFTFKFFQLGLTTYLFSLLVYVLILINSKIKLLNSIILTLFIVELFLVFLSPHKSYNERNGTFYSHSYQYNTGLVETREPHSSKMKDKTEFNYLHTYNDIGLRDEETNGKNYKYFILGDSFVESVGTDQFNKIDVHIENLLNCKSCVLNLGHSGNDLYNAYNQLESLYAKGFSADTILLNVNSTDIYEMIVLSSIYGIEGIKHKSVMFQFCYGSSFIFRHLIHLLYDYDFNFLTPEQEVEYRKIILSKMQDRFLDFNKLALSKNSKFIILFQPLLSEIQNNQNEYISLQPFLKENEITHYFFLNSFKTKPEELYWPLDKHFNKLGYLEYSKLIVDSIKSK